MNEELLGWAAAADQAEAAAVATPAAVAVGQQAVGGDLGVIVANDRDRRTLAWLRGQVGDAAILDAVSRLSGNRKQYLSNISKLLHVDLPTQLSVADREAAIKHLAAIRAIRAKID